MNTNRTHKNLKTYYSQDRTTVGVLSLGILCCPLFYKSQLMKNLLLVIAVAVISAATTTYILTHPIHFDLFGHKLDITDASFAANIYPTTGMDNGGDINFPAIMNDDEPHLAGVKNPMNDLFTLAAKKAVPAVVHIKVETESAFNANNNIGNDIFGRNYGTDDIERKPSSSGSGVLVSADGYVMTNNHVVAGGTSIKVTLFDKSVYDALLVGADASTDLAVLKIKPAAIPRSFKYFNFGNSDSLNVGEWVLAVGNPFNLSSTVTAGIVSAKARNINLLDQQNAIEAFIQTDAEVNVGNSGGALVNLEGSLVGITTAIASNSGISEGYSFAIPGNMIRKVYNDIKQYGAVQRAYLGANTRNITPEIAEKNNLPSMNGVYVDYVPPGSTADDAKIKKGDIIIEINGSKVNSVPELQEKIAGFNPGQKISITILRKKETLFLNAILKNIKKETGTINSPIDELRLILGADFETMTPKELSDMGLKSGIRIARVLEDGLLRRTTEIKQGLVVLRINNLPIKSINELAMLIRASKKGDMITFEGIYPGSGQRPKMFPFTME